MFYFSFISSESSIFFLCSFFSSSPLHQGMPLAKRYLLSIHLILPRSNTSPRLTLLNPFPIGRATNSQVLICVQYVSIYYCTCSFCRYFVRAPCNSSTLLCSFITESFKTLFSHSLHLQTCNSYGQQGLCQNLFLYFYAHGEFKGCRVLSVLIIQKIHFLCTFIYSLC